MRFLAFILFCSTASAQVAPFVFASGPASVSYTTVYDTIDASNRDTGCEGAYLTVSNLLDIMGSKTGDGEHQFGAQFQLNIPNAATIDTCYMFINIFDGTGWTTTDTAKIEIYDVDNSAVYSEGGGVSVRTFAALVGSTVNWTGQNISGEVTNQTPNLASLLQSVVNRGGWAANQYVGFAISAKSLVADHYMRFKNWDRWNTYGAGELRPWIKVVYH